MTLSIGLVIAVCLFGASCLCLLALRPSQHERVLRKRLDHTADSSAAIDAIPESSAAPATSPRQSPGRSDSSSRLKRPARGGVAGTLFDRGGAALDELLRQAQVNLRLTHFLIGVAFCTILAATCGFVPLRWLGACFGAGIGLSMPCAWLWSRRNKRRDLILRQLPAAFDLMSRMLRAGQSSAQAMQAASEAFEGPLAEELRLCVGQQNLGIRPETAFREMAARSGVLELRLFSAATALHGQVGGNLSETPTRLADLIRSRARLRQQVRTLTAEGRMQGMTLTALPVFVFLVMMYVNRPYVQLLLSQGWLLVITIGMMIAGTIWIRAIVNVDPTSE
jgi:tight adherence protein B